MEKESGAHALRLFMVSLAFFSVSVSSDMAAYAGSVSIAAVSDSRGAAIQEVSGEWLFDGTELMPGASQQADITVLNRLGRAVYYDWKCSTDSENELYRSLTVSIADSGGNNVYSGSLQNIKASSGPLQPGTQEKYILRLKLPESDDGRSAGQTADFNIQLTFRSDISENVSDDSDGDGGQECYTAAESDAVPDFAGQGKNITGGGTEKTFSRPDMTLTAGIDSGTWVAEPAGNTDFENIYGTGSAGKANVRWRYRFSDGSCLKGGFALVENPYSTKAMKFGWYYFDAGGIMRVCWIKTPGDVWYHAHEISDGNLGMLETGWLQCAGDGKKYFLDRKSGEMRSGWVGLVNNFAVCDFYYFARLEDTYRQNWFLNTAIGRWMYDRLGGRSYGSMYADETTPDKSIVDKNGRKVSG